MNWRNITFYLLLALIVAGWTYAVYLMDGELSFGGLFMVALCSIITFPIIYCLMAIVWRIKNGVNVFATLETDPEAVKAQMLVTMQYGHPEGLKGAIKEFNKNFRNYPQWNLEDWEVFRAWYKDTIDRALESPEIYTLHSVGGAPYYKESDPLYDPNAPDWEQFDIKRNYSEDDDDEDDDDEYDDDDFDEKDDDDEAIAFALGMGLGAGLMSGNS